MVGVSIPLIKCTLFTRFIDALVLYLRKNSPYSLALPSLLRLISHLVVDLAGMASHRIISPIALLAVSLLRQLL